MTEPTPMQPTVQPNVDLTTRNTFGVRAKAELFAEPASVEDLRALLADPRFQGMPRRILGGGSNLLITTETVPGLVIRPAMTGITLIDENDGFRWVRVGAGESWDGLVKETLARGWPGLENLAAVPGSVGGAAVQNIGAYGLEAAERIFEVECLNPETLDVEVIPVDDCDYGYRTSLFKTERTDLIVTAVTFVLPKSFEARAGYKELEAWFKGEAPASAQALADAVRAIRARKLPDPAVLGSAGSFFKNPVVSRAKMVQLVEENPKLVAYPLAGGRSKLAAGWLIDAAGLKGVRRGQAGVYERQALVLVNHGGATGAEIATLADEVRQAVRRHFGVTLEAEPVFW